jgi:putative membrane protein
MWSASTAFVTAWYPWIKAVHVIGVIAWMAGLLYLPRLFVYHCDATAGSAQSETFKVMERRLLRAIMNPAMVVVWVMGLLMLSVQDWGQYWLHAKLVLVAAMSWMHHVFARWHKEFVADRNRHPARIYRLANEVPTVLLIAIVIVVVVKPF